MLEVFSNNTDILYLGQNPTSFAELKKDVPRYRRYRMLFTLMGFALQETYSDRSSAREKLGAQDPRVYFALPQFHFVARRLHALHATGGDAEVSRIHHGYCKKFRAPHSANERGGISKR
jgi:hypothetical protein